MAVPAANNEISLAKIRNEIETNAYGTAYTAGSTSLTSLSTGVYDTINTANAAADRPDGATPHNMSEFFSYDHDASSFSWGTPSSFPLGTFECMGEDRTGDSINAASTLQFTHGTNQITYQTVEEVDGDNSGDGTSATRTITYSGGSLSTLEARVVLTGVTITEYSDTTGGTKDARSRFSNNSHLAYNAADSSASQVDEYSPGTNQTITGAWRSVNTTGNFSVQLQCRIGSSGTDNEKDARISVGTVTIELRANSSSTVTVINGLDIDIHASNSNPAS
jgi:hypothetical protein